MNLVLGRGTGVFPDPVFVLGPSTEEDFIQVVLMFYEAFY